MLEYGTNSLSTNRLLCQFVCAERLCEQILLRARSNDFYFVMNVTDSATQLSVLSLRNLIRDWKAQRPPSLDCSLLTV